MEDFASFFFSSSMELILILWSRYRVSKIDTSWFWFFRSLYKINLFLISSLNIWFFEIDFHVFFFTSLYVELSQFYSHGCDIRRLTWVNYDFFSLFFLVSPLNIFFYWEFIFIAFLGLLFVRSVSVPWSFSWFTRVHIGWP